MADEPVSLTQHVELLEAGAQVVAAAFLGGQPALALADGCRDPSTASARRRPSRRRDPGGGERRRAHSSPAATTAASSRPTRSASTARCRRREGPLDRRGGDARRRDRLVGRQARARPRRASAPSRPGPRRRTVRGLAFPAEGLPARRSRITMAFRCGFPTPRPSRTLLEWKGSHLDATVSPDGRFLVTSMQENALHGWRLADSRNMRMTGYPGKTRSLSWSQDGHWLATSGADACVVWPFKDKDGPMGKAPRECGVRAAAHLTGRVPSARAGGRDRLRRRLVLLCRLGDGAEILVRDAGSRGRARSARSPGTNAARACCSAPTAASPAC